MKTASILVNAKEYGPTLRTIIIELKSASQPLSEICPESKVLVEYNMFISNLKNTIITEFDQRLIEKQVECVTYFKCFQHYLIFNFHINAFKLTP